MEDNHFLSKVRESYLSVFESLKELSNKTTDSKDLPKVLYKILFKSSNHIYFKIFEVLRMIRTMSKPSNKNYLADMKKNFLDDEKLEVCKPEGKKSEDIDRASINVKFKTCAVILAALNCLESKVVLSPNISNSEAIDISKKLENIRQVVRSVMKQTRLAIRGNFSSGIHIQKPAEEVFENLVGPISAPAPEEQTSSSLALSDKTNDQ